MTLPTLIPLDQLTAKVAAGTAFQADAAKATLAENVGHLTTASGMFFSDNPGDLGFPTVLPEFAGLPQGDLDNLTSLATQFTAAGTSFTGFDGHLDSQLTDLPKNINIFANHADLLTSQGNGQACDTGLGKFFGSILNGAKELLGAIGGVFNGIVAAIAQVGNTLTYIQTQLASALAQLTSQVAATVAAVTAYITNEINSLASAIGDLINSALTGLFSSLFGDDCVAQLMKNPSVSNVLGAGKDIVTG